MFTRFSGVFSKARTAGIPRYFCLRTGAPLFFTGVPQLYAQLYAQRGASLCTARRGRWDREHPVSRAARMTEPVQPAVEPALTGAAVGGRAGGRNAANGLVTTRLRVTNR